MKPSVVVECICKVFGSRAALKDLCFSVEPGSIFGLIGPNGAGKTTTLSILAGLVAPTSGRASILGLEVEPNRGELAGKVGFASPQFSFFDYLTGAEVILTCGLMHRLTAREAGRRLQDLLRLLDLGDAAEHYLHQYSHGMRQKLALACALIHAPEVLLLDEPFIGLDPTSAYRVFHTLRKIRAAGRTVLVSSHDLALVERLCDRAAILHEGTLRREIPLAHSPQNPEGERASGLESLLWKVVGTPEFDELSWI